MERFPNETQELHKAFVERDELDQAQRDLAEHLFMITTVHREQPKRRELPPEAKVLAARIDHTYLTITPDNPLEDMKQVIRVCREAAENGFASVCVRPEHVRLAAQLFKCWNVTDVSVCTVIDFPKAKGEIAGTAHPEEKAKEAWLAQKDGATEFDVVIDYEALLRHEFEWARKGIFTVADSVKSRDAGAIVKAILETARLRKLGGGLPLYAACSASIQGGADFLKTSTGYADEGGATPEAVEHLADYAHPHGVLVKASGGIKTLEQAQALIKAGADRIGTSSGVKIVEEKLASLAQQ